jgi:hypothetical protein
MKLYDQFSRVLPWLDSLMAGVSLSQQCQKNDGSGFCVIVSNENSTLACEGSYRDVYADVNRVREGLDSSASLTENAPFFEQLGQHSENRSKQPIEM